MMGLRRTCPVCGYAFAIQESPLPPLVHVLSGDGQWLAGPIARDSWERFGCPGCGELLRLSESFPVQAPRTDDIRGADDAAARPCGPSRPYTVGDE